MLKRDRDRDLPPPSAGHVLAAMGVGLGTFFASAAAVGVWWRIFAWAAGVGR